ncbi:MAG: CRISPR-associated endonuclease Cas2 [Campylobacterales bacterium]|nr:CRISPR-associated endonuclease Cas2 [Campylobacterales bacterium]
MKFAVVYDISNDKRRKKVSDLLEGFGYRVNFSVFEIIVNQTKLNKIKKELAKKINKKEDSIRFYHICENCIPKSFELCDKDGIFEEKELFI